MFRSVSLPDEDYKMVILMRNDLKMGKGKLAAQAGHAAVYCAMAVKKKDPKLYDNWTMTGQAKVVLKVNSEQDLFDFEAMAKAKGIFCAIVCDAGRTQLDPGTYTCLGIGPEECSLIDKITGELKML